jgi:hypothetical protein
MCYSQNEIVYQILFFFQCDNFTLINNLWKIWLHKWKGALHKFFELDKFKLIQGNKINYFDWNESSKQFTQNICFPLS